MIKFTHVSVGMGLAISIFALVGCQTVPYQGQAHDVKRKPNVDGIVAVPVDPRPEDRAKADEHMKSNCGALAVKVLEEGEVVVGQKTKSNESETGRASTEHSASLFGIPITSGRAAGKDTSSESVTEQVKEWQISYKCDNSAPTGKRLQ